MPAATKNNRGAAARERPREQSLDLQGLPELPARGLLPLRAPGDEQPAPRGPRAPPLGGGRLG